MTEVLTPGAKQQKDGADATLVLERTQRVTENDGRFVHTEESTIREPLRRRREDRLLFTTEIEETPETPTAPPAVQPPTAPRGLTPLPYWDAMLRISRLYLDASRDALRVLAGTK